MTAPQVEPLARAIQNYIDAYGYIDFERDLSIPRERRERERPIQEDATLLAEDIIQMWEGEPSVTDDLEKQADETAPEAEPAPVEDPQDGEAGSADTESGVEPESEE